MLPSGRNDVSDPTSEGIYHAWSTCAHRAPVLTHNPFPHGERYDRRGWIVTYLKWLTSHLAMESVFYSVLPNEINVILRNRPDLAASWSRREVATRWLNVTQSIKRDDPAGTTLWTPTANFYLELFG